ncbi:MAG TPA: phosphoadenylyl-sulfate reductase [Rickettsiales bacterium]|nr:phosphoadenylyl-sulfate reductase [Rickettsiales bacterium]
MTTSLDRLQNFYGELDTHQLLRTMIRQEFPGTIALLTSFGADAGLLLALVAEVEPETPVLFLDTGKHFPETLEYGRTLEKSLGLKNVHWIKPDPEMLGRIDADGMLWKTQPNRCCWLRKVEPLDRTIESLGILALITGRKRYQTPERANMQTIELDENGVFRINPLAHWSKDDQREAVMLRNIPPHPLVAKGYKSIGCEPCTVPVAAGQDERAGRWAHTIGLENEQKTECGLHIPASDMTWSV